jgi:hypothetical protein
VGAEQRRRRLLGEPGLQLVQRALKHDPEKWLPVFGKDHAQIKS